MRELILNILDKVQLYSPFWALGIFFICAGFIIRNMKKQKELQRKGWNDLQGEGFAVQKNWLGNQFGRRPIARIWAKFKYPTPLLIEVSNETMAVDLLNSTGMDTKIGDERFDQEFLICTNKEKELKELLSEEVKQQFYQLGKVTFMTGSERTIFEPGLYSTDNKNK